MSRVPIALLVLVLAAVPIAAQQTPESLVTAYDALADTILGVRRAEAGLVQAVLDQHFRAARAAMKAGEWEKAAAQMALFANEGDNAIGGVRKRLLEGGHHYNAEGEEKGIFEPGFVLVNRQTKQKLLKASTDLRQAGDDAGRQAAWSAFETLAQPIAGSK